MNSIPNYLFPVSGLSACEIVGEVQQKIDKDGAVKISPVFGVPGWVMPVEVVLGERKKFLPDGQIKEVLDTRRVNVTVWKSEIPKVHPGDYVSFDGIYVGAVESSLFMFAREVVVLTSDSKGK